MIVGLWGVRAIYIAATAGGLALGVLLWRNRDKKGAVPLCIELFAAAFWSFCLLLSTASQEWLAFGAIRVMYLGVGVTVAATLVFALEYTGRERYITRRTLAVLSVHPILVALIAIINPGGAFFADLQTSGAVGVVQEWGTFFWIHSAYSYGLILFYTVLLVGFIYRARHTLYQGQAAALVIAISSPVPLNLIFLSGWVAFDTTPIGFVVASAWYALAIVRYEYTNITPVAREKVIATVRDGMLVVDTNDKVVDCNPAAREMLGVDDSAVGATVTELIDSPEATSVFATLTGKEGEETISYGELWLRIESSPIQDDRDRHVGWLLMLEDVTERKRRERDLEQQIEKLDQFASLVSHDLRNPINVAAGYIDQARETGDLSYLDKAEEATDRMEAIIQDALTLAREGQDVTDPTEVPLSAVAREAWETVETNGAELVVEEDAQIVADETRLTRLFENLYRNSVEHGADSEESAAPGPSELVVTVAVEDETASDLTIVCSDSGTGIPSEHIDQVFEDGFTTEREGTGLGLAIVRQIAQAHDWELRAGESDTGGARFEISSVRRPL